MGAPQIVREVYSAHLRNFGEPCHSVTYDDAKNAVAGPPRIDVMVWLPDAKCSVTTLSTIGMCAAPMEGAPHRAELHFAIRRALGRDEFVQCASFLANLAIYPFTNHTRLDWWHRLQSPGRIPLFPSARAILFHPPFVADGWDSIETTEATVKLLNVVPLSEEEAKMRVPDIHKRWAAEGTDILLPR